MRERTVTISNRLGLHARAAARLVRCATQFGSEVELRREDTQQIADGKSILSVLMLAASNGTRIVIQTKGPDEERALDAISEMIEQCFGEDMVDGLY